MDSDLSRSTASIVLLKFNRGNIYGGCASEREIRSDRLSREHPNAKSRTRDGISVKHENARERRRRNCRSLPGNRVSGICRARYSETPRRVTRQIKSAAAAATLIESPSAI